MNIGSWLVASGATLLAMSIALVASLAGQPPLAVAKPVTIDVLTVGWTLACLPYPSERGAPTSYPQAFGCAALDDR